jgi:hydroxyacylglutathione hydrolase
VVLSDSAVRAGDRIWRVNNSNFPSNTYICATNAPNECFLVDPGLDAESIDATLIDLALHPRFIFCTHGHFDHVGSSSFFQKKYGTKVFLHAADVKTLKASNLVLMAFKLSYRIELPELDIVSDDDFSMTIDGKPLRYHAVAGHTPGSCVIQFGQALFTGDTLYRRGVGLSRLHGEDPVRLRASLRAVWNRFPPESMVYPGHGDSASFGWIKQNNQELLRFIGMAESQEGEPFV